MKRAFLLCMMLAAAPLAGIAQAKPTSAWPRSFKAEAEACAQSPPGGRRR